MRLLTYLHIAWLSLLFAGCFGLTSCSNEEPEIVDSSTTLTIPQTVKMQFVVSTEALDENSLDSRAYVPNYGLDGNIDLTWKMGLRFAIYDCDKNVVMAADPVMGDVNPDLFSFEGLSAKGEFQLSCLLEANKTYYYAFWADPSGYDPEGNIYQPEYSYKDADNSWHQSDWANTVLYLCDWDLFRIGTDELRNETQFYDAEFQKFFLTNAGIAVGSFEQGLTEKVYVDIKAAVSRFIVAGERGDYRDYMNMPFGFNFDDEPSGGYEEYWLKSRSYYVPTAITFEKFDGSWQIAEDSWREGPIYTLNDWNFVLTRVQVAKIFFNDPKGFNVGAGHGWFEADFISFDDANNWGKVHCVNTILSPSGSSFEDWGVQGFFESEGSTKCHTFTAGGIYDFINKLAQTGYYGWYDDKHTQPALAFDDMGFAAGDQFLVTWH